VSSSKYYTVDDLITSVTRRATIPVSDTTISNDDLIRFANEELSESIMALILSTREEIYLTYEDITLVNGKQNYPIPYRAIGAKVRIIKPLLPNQSNGVNAEGPALVPIDLETVYNWNYTNSNNSGGFYLRNDEIILLSNVNSFGTQTLRVFYYLRPNDLVALDRGSKIRTINSTTGVITVDSVPQNITNSTKVDLIQALPNHKTYLFDQDCVVNAAAKTITLTTVPATLSIGDYICTAGETVTPQIPVDIIPLLEQSVVCKVLEAIGDTEGLKNAYTRLQTLEKRVVNIIDNRIEAPGRKIIGGAFYRNRNRYGY